jgi:hypothetical protein
MKITEIVQNLTNDHATVVQTLVVGFAGKRNLSSGFASLAEGEKTLADALDAVLVELGKSRSTSNSELVGVSALAMGADTVFAERLLDAGHALRVTLPDRPEHFFNPADYGNDATTLARSKCLLERDGILDVSVMEDRGSRGERFARCAEAIVEACAVLVVAITDREWDTFNQWHETLHASSPSAADASIPSSFKRGGSPWTLCRAFRLGRECHVLVPDGAGGWMCRCVKAKIAG